MKINLPIVYSQWDPRWAQEKLGSSNSSTIYDYGCILSCLAMACKYYSKDENPSTLNVKLAGLKPSGYSVDLYIPGSVNRIYKDIQENRTVTPSLLTDQQVGEIRAAIDAGFPVLIGLDYNPKTVAYDSHFVLVVDYNPADESDFTIADPLGGKLHSLKDYLGWFKPNARNTIESYVVLQGKAPQQTGQLPDNYPDIIHNSTQWDVTCEQLNLGKSKDTNYDALAKVIAGYKSRETDWSNKLIDKQQELASAQAEVANREEQVSRLKEQVTANTETIQKLQKQLSDGVGDVEALRKEMQGKLDAVYKEKGDLQKQLAECQAGNPGADNLLIELIKKILKALGR